jgi:DNA-binding beta-propeller fold protein YncE
MKYRCAVAVAAAGLVAAATVGCSSNNATSESPQTAQTSQASQGARLVSYLPQIELPAAVRSPHGVAVDAVGNVYYTDTHRGYVLKPGAGAPAVLPLGIRGAALAVAVDSAGAVYVTDAYYQGNRVLKLPPGADAPVALPLTGLNNPLGVAVDSAGNVYVTDTGNNRVLKLPAG